jgi:hypothetical protein
MRQFKGLLPLIMQMFNRFVPQITKFISGPGANVMPMAFPQSFLDQMVTQFSGPQAEADPDDPFNVLTPDDPRRKQQPKAPKA